MRRLLALIASTIILAGCSAAVAPTSAPITGAPTDSPAPVASAAASTPSATCAGDTWDDGVDPAMTLDGTPLRFQYQTAAPLDGSAGGWSDSVPGPTIRFGSADAQTIEADSGANVSLRPPDGVTFADARLELYPLDAEDAVDEAASPVETADLVVDGGGVTVPMPTAAGRWLLSIYGHWQTDCAAGDGYVDLLLVTT